MKPSDFETSRSNAISMMGELWRREIKAGRDFEQNVGFGRVLLLWLRLSPNTLPEPLPPDGFRQELPEDPPEYGDSGSPASPLPGENRRLALREMRKT